MSDKSMRLMSNATFPLAVKSTVVRVAPEPDTVTEESDKTLLLFAGIHKSKQFSLAAAHQSFAGLKRKK